jgi:hypothetical protein
MQISPFRVSFSISRSEQAGAGDPVAALSSSSSLTQSINVLVDERGKEKIMCNLVRFYVFC